MTEELLVGTLEAVAAPSIAFVLPHEAALVGRMREVTGPLPWDTFATGERIWVLQTFVEMALRGLPVELRCDLPRAGFALFHAKDRGAIARLASEVRRCLLVGIRADSSEALVADYEVVQNRHFADDTRRFYVPHWPQPGLLPRDPSRGPAIRRISFKGFAGNLHPSLRTLGWSEALTSRGISFSHDAPVFAGRETNVADSRWNDYREVDVLVAIRPASRRLHREKPASKLVNAWLAGVPAILGPELPYREVRCCELCYLEARDAASAIEALDRLRSDPGLYGRMVVHGQDRGRELNQPAVAQRWDRLLTEILPQAVASRDPRDHYLRRLSPRLRVLCRRLARLATARPLR